MELQFKTQELQFKHPFGISVGTRISTPVVFTELFYEGFIGYGEASMPPYLGESHETVLAFLNKAKLFLKAVTNPFEIESILTSIDVIAPNNTAAKASIDIALHDLVGKLKQQPCYAFWNLDKNNTPYTSYTIGIDESRDLLIQKVNEAQPYQILKIKLGSDSDKKMIEIIRSVTSKKIAVDVNQGWKDKYRALDMIDWLATQDVLFVEQPLPKTNIDDMAWLHERSALPLIADESCQRLDDIKKIKNIFSGINIKLMKCTGIHEAYKMIQEAKKYNLKILIGCMSETSCAISAAAQLSPLVDWADLDGPLLIKEDYFSGIAYEDGKIVLNEKPGIGVGKLLV